MRIVRADRMKHRGQASLVRAGQDDKVGSKRARTTSHCSSMEPTTVLGTHSTWHTEG